MKSWRIRPPSSFFLSRLFWLLGTLAFLREFCNQLFNFCRKGHLDLDMNLWINLGSTAILATLSLLTHEHIYFYLCNSCIIPSNNILWYSVYMSCTSFVKVISKYLILFNAIVNRIYLSFFILSLFIASMYKYNKFFCVDLASLPKLLVLIAFSMEIMSFTNTDNFASFFIGYFLLFSLPSSPHSNLHYSLEQKW